jgi:hypothetical protein
MGTSQEGILVDEDANYECPDNPDGDHHQLKQRNRRDQQGPAPSTRGLTLARYADLFR